MRKIRWGVLGTAHIAEGQTIPGMQNTKNCELYAIAGRSLEKAKEFQNRFHFKKAYGSYDELLEDPEVEAVYIPLPNHLHKEWVLKAAAHKKHILCEKPMSGSAKDTREMIQACKDAGVILMEAFAYLHSPLMQKLKLQIEEGLIGEVNFIESTFYTPGYEDNIRIHRETLGGSVYDLGCYNITFASYLFGEVPISAKAVSHFTEEHIDDMTCGQLLYPGNKRAVFSCAMFPHQRGDRSFIYGTKGILEVPVSFNAEGTQKWYLIEGEKRTAFFMDIPNNYMLEVQQLGDCILNGEAPIVSADFSIQTAETMDMVLKPCGY
jgi:predicted dehydrogenase